MCDQIEIARLAELKLALLEERITLDQYERMVQGDYSETREKSEGSKRND